MKNSENPGFKYLFLLSKISSITVLCILSGFFIGFYIEKKFPMNGAAIIIGVISGVGLGFYRTLKEIMKLDTKLDDDI